MALAAVCVDRGRVIVKEPTARVEGRSGFVPVPGQWFRCRLFLENSNDVPDVQQSHWTSVSQPQLLTLAKDLDGEPLVLRGDHSVQVNSRELGNAIWRTNGEPQPLRKKRRVIGYLAYLERVVEREFDDLLQQRVPDVADLGPSF